MQQVEWEWDDDEDDKDYVKIESSELERLILIAEKANIILEAHPPSGSKEGRSDYVTMVSCDKIYNLRKAFER